MSSKNTSMRFESFEAFVAQAKVVPAITDSHCSRSKDVDRKWAGTDTFEQAVELATKGWAEGAERALGMRASIDSAVREIVAARQSQYAWDVTGDVVDVGKYLGGEPECFLTTVDDGESSTGKVVRLVANLAASGAVSTDSLFARGAVILAAVDIMESLGRRVELWIAHGSRGSGSVGVFQQFVQIKPAHQPLDPDRVAYCLCHASCLRRLAFSVMEQNGHLPNVTWPHAVKFDQDAIVTNEAYRGHDFTEEELLEEVASLCGKCGITIPLEEIRALVAGGSR